MKNNINTVRVNISLPQELHKKYTKEAFDAHMSFSAYIRKALLKHAECLEKKKTISSSEKTIG